MKMTVENIVKNKIKVVVESATSDYGQTNDHDRWWGARTSYPVKNIPGSTLNALVKKYNYQVIDGGWKDGELISLITTVIFEGRK